MAKKHEVEETDDENVGVLEYSEDISNAEAPEPLPDRAYTATIKAVERKVSATSGKPYLAVQFFIARDDYPADYDADNAPEGTVLVFNRVSPEDNAQARFRMRRFCEAIGAPTGRRISIGEWVGLQARVTLKAEEYEGVRRATITKVEAV